MSRCRMPLLCAKWMALQTATRIRAFASSGSAEPKTRASAAWSCISSLQALPSTRFITITGAPWASMPTS
jgi:hypothetical protein